MGTCLLHTWQWFCDCSCSLPVLGVAPVPLQCYVFHPGLPFERQRGHVLVWLLLLCVLCREKDALNLLFLLVGVAAVHAQCLMQTCRHSAHLLHSDKHLCACQTRVVLSSHLSYGPVWGNCQLAHGSSWDCC